MEFPKTLYLEPRDVADLLVIFRAIKNICPKESNDSLAHQLLQVLHIEEFVSRLKSLETKVTLVAPRKLCDENTKDGRVCIYRVEVKPSNKQLTVQKPKDSMDQFLNIRHLPRSFLVTSHSMSVIDTKLAVYKKYKHLLELEKLRIFHELDSQKEILLYCAQYSINSFRDQVEKLEKSIPREEVPNLVRNAADVAFSREEIRECCQNIEIVSEGQHIGSVLHGSYSCRSPFTIRRIKEILVSRTIERIGQEFTNEVLAGILKHIQKLLEVELQDEIDKINILKSFTIKNIGTIAIGAVIVGLVFELLNPLLGIIMAVVAVGSYAFTFIRSVDVNSEEWRNNVADELYDKIAARKAQIIADVVRKMESVCEKTATELKHVNTKLTKARNGIPITDQKQQIDEWILREFRIDNIKRCPSVLHFIAGRKGEEQKIVMKVFLQPSDQSSKLFCKDHAVNIPSNAEFEFVDVKIKSNLKANATIMHDEEKGIHIMRDEQNRIKEILRSRTDELFAKHSNLVSVSMSPVKYIGDQVIHETCIALYCLDADLIPFGEEPLPKFIEEFECNIREDFIQFGLCINCQSLGHGCSIGRYGEVSSGSLGFFVKKRSLPSKILCDGFLTAAHVALTDDLIAELNEKKLSDCALKNRTVPIVHPSFEDCASNNIIGLVEDSFFGNHNSVGIDAAFIKADVPQHQGGNYDSFFSFDISSDEEYDVIKKGRTTGETKGLLKDRALAIRKPFPDRAGIYLSLSNCFSIYDSDSEIFFSPGDSGSAVYVINKSDNTRQPLGLAFGRFTKRPITFVSPIEQIADVLNLAVVRPAEPMEIP